MRFKKPTVPDKTPQATALVILSLLASLCCHAQQVYSVAIFSGGTAYADFCSFDIPFAPYHYRLTERSQYEDTNGLVIIDVGHEKERGGVPCRYLDVECGAETFTVWLDREPPLRARERAAEDAESERRLKENIASGYFRVKTFVLSNRTDSASDQDALFTLYDREKFQDGGWIRAMGPESNVIRITASTNDMVIWDRVIKEFDQPHPK
jgi:hypothetical protein